MSTRLQRDRELLRHVLEAIENTATHERLGRSFTAERAVIFELITIGEAIKNLSADLKESYPATPWQRIADARNRMVHDYEDISSKIIWDIVENHLTVLKDQVENILKAMDQ